MGGPELNKSRSRTQNPMGSSGVLCPCQKKKKTRIQKTSKDFAAAAHKNRAKNCKRSV